jgi:hypothetical protein
MIYYGKDYPNGLKYSPDMPDADLLRWVHMVLTGHGESPYYQFMGDIVELAEKLEKKEGGTP